MHLDRSQLAAVTIILIVSLLKIIAECVACCARYQDVTGLAVCQYSAEMSEPSLKVLYDETLKRPIQEARLSDFCSAAPRPCPIKAQYFRGTL